MLARLHRPGRPAEPGRRATPAAEPSAASRRAAADRGGRAGVVVVAAIVTALILRENVAGTGIAGPAPVASPTERIDTGKRSALQSTAASSSAARRRRAPDPVPGLPHSSIAAEEVLLGSRVVDGRSNLYQFDAATGELGKQLTTGSAGTQFPILSPDRGSVVYVQTSPTG